MQFIIYDKLYGVGGKVVCNLSYQTSCMVQEVRSYAIYHIRQVVCNKLYRVGGKVVCNLSYLTSCMVQEVRSYAIYHIRQVVWCRREGRMQFIISDKLYGVGGKVVCNLSYLTSCMQLKLYCIGGALQLIFRVGAGKNLHSQLWWRTSAVFT